MVDIGDDFVSITRKVRKAGNSLVFGFTVDECKYLKLERGSMVQVFIKKIGYVAPKIYNKPKVKEEPDMDEMYDELENGIRSGNNIESRT